MPTRVWVAYVSDNGTTYNRKTLSDLVTPLALTGAAAGANPPLPRAIKPRYVLGYNPATGRQHKLVGLPTTSTMWTGGDSTVTVPDPADRTTATLDLNILGRIGEKRFAL